MDSGAHMSDIAAVQDLSYRETESDEVEDMLQLIAHVKRCHPGIEAVSSGAIASDYQRLRVEHVGYQNNAPCQMHVAIGRLRLACCWAGGL